MTTRRILGIDPSLSYTAAALLTADEGEQLSGKFSSFWTIEPKGPDLAGRLFDLLREVESVIVQARPTVVVVEMPADRPMGGPGRSFNRRSMLTLPSYGMAVGICLAATMPWGESSDATSQLFPSSSDWTGGDVPKSKDDPHKERRVEYVNRLYRLKPGTLGCKTNAGNVADAVLIARWGLWRTNP